MDTVLMADDDKDDCSLVEDGFKQTPFKVRVHFVEDGAQLMAYLRGQGNARNSVSSLLPDLILLDLNMPKKDGREALKEMKTLPHIREIPVLILTTSKSPQDVALCYGLGASAYIIKPSGFSQLVEALDSLGRFWFKTATLPPVSR
jgi:CheY-like chemotaxis protein